MKTALAGHSIINAKISLLLVSSIHNILFHNWNKAMNVKIILIKENTHLKYRKEFKITIHKQTHPLLKVQSEEMISSTVYNPQHTVPLCLHD